MRQLPSGGTFKLTDFKNFLLERHAAEAVNEQSMRGPFAKWAKQGFLEIAQPGLGRAPVIYRKPNQ